MKISFFENIFYWNWTFAPKSGKPQRSSELVSFSQAIYALFSGLLILHIASTLNDEIWIFIVVMLVVSTAYIILLIVNGAIYNTKKYNTLKEKYAQMTDTERQETKRTFFIYITMSILTLVVDIIMWSRLKW